MLHRTTVDGRIGDVGVALCQLTGSSGIIGTLVYTTGGNGGIAMIVRLLTHFSRTSGVG